MCLLSSLLYVIVLESSLQTLGALRGIPHKPEHRRTVSAYTGDIAVMLLNRRHKSLVGTALKKYEAVTSKSQAQYVERQVHAFQ